jgi:hypothetical protein
MSITKNKLMLAVIAIILSGLSSSVSSAESEAKELIRDFLSGKIAEEKLYDAQFLEIKLSSSDSSAFDQVLTSFQNSMSSQEFLIQREIWKTLVKSNPTTASISYAEHLAATSPEKLKIMFEVAASSDYSGSSERPWDFSQYRPILEATEDEPFERLISYMLRQSPGDALKQLVDVYGDDLNTKQRKDIITKGLQITDYLRNHGSLFELRSSPKESFEEGSIGQIAMDFFLELKSLDKWYLDVFVVAALEKSGAVNVSPELIEYFKSKPESLANKLRQGGGSAFLPAQKISLESLKNGQGETLRNDIIENRLNDRRQQKPNNSPNRKGEQPQEYVDEVIQPNLPWIITGVLLLVGLGLLFLFKTFKGKS